MNGNRLTRRQLLGRGGAALGGLVAAGAVGFDLPHGKASGARGAASGSTPSPAPAARPAGYAPGALVHQFVSRPDLIPPAISVTTTSEGPITTPPYILLSSTGYPTTGPGQPGNLILDRSGRLVWFKPSGTRSFLGLAAQTYQGKPVLTWWQGKITNGHGAGEGVIADASYTTINTVQAGNGLMADLHEFAITALDTALVTAYSTAPADLTAVGGKADGYVLAGHAQEIDIATGKVLFQWDSLDHVGVTESMKSLSGGTKDNPFDYFHINSLALAPDGDLLISSRNTCTVYKVSRQTGEIAWRLGGRQSSFEMGPGTRFYFQHHVRPHGASTLSIFDDGGSPPRLQKVSRAILLDIDTVAMSAKLRHAYTHPAGLAAANQGSMQVLPDGRVFVGWGDEPYFSEFSADGTLKLDGEFPAGDQSYRAFTADWTGTPGGKPTVRVLGDPAGGRIAYVSWNGATEVAGWIVRAGPTAASLSEVARQERTGFETAIAVTSNGPYFAVTAYDASNAVLGQSATVQIQRA